MARTLYAVDETEKIKKPGMNTRARRQGTSANKTGPSQAEPERKPQSRKKPVKRPSLKAPPKRRQLSSVPEPLRSPLDQTPPEPTTPARAPITQAQALQELVRRAGEGNETCLAGLRGILDQNPTLWRTAGDVSALAERMWAELVAGGSKLVEMSIPRKLKEFKAGLAGASPSPLESLLIDYISVTWLASMQGETAAAQVGGSAEQARLRLRRAESAAKRFTGAVKTLSLVRALVPKSLPLNKEELEE